MSTSLKVGWARTGWTVLGQELALAVQLLITALGVGLFIAQHPHILLVVKIIGALYLAYLGVRLLLERPQEETAQSASSSSARATVGGLVRRGFIVNATNPKAILFLLAFIPQFIDPSGNLWAQYAIVMATLVGVDIVVMWGVFGLTAKSMSRFTHSVEGQLTINRIFGVLFLVIAGLVAFMPLH